LAEADAVEADQSSQGAFATTLNPEQRRAMLATEGAVRVIAGPGTGKTRTLTARFCYLADTLGVAPQNILCATFTNRAASELKGRIRSALGDLDLGHIGTFHSFCARLLKEDIHVLHYPANFIILDVEDQKQILLKIFDEMGLSLRQTTIKRTLDEVLEAKKLFAVTYIDDILALENDTLRAKIKAVKNCDEEIFLRYLYEQKKCFGCDFNDLINFAVYILENFPAIRSKWQERMQYVMVDEFQDVSRRQYRLAQLLAGKHGNLFIVGDPDQTIYSWRGSHARLFLDFDKVYPHAITISLSTNYRSRPEILAAAATLIAKNSDHFPNTLHAVRENGPKPLYYHAQSDKAEAEWIVGQIETLRAAGVSPAVVAVLYRAHYLSRALEERFAAKGLAYVIYGGLAFYGRREIKDILCYMRMLTAGDDLAFLRSIKTPARRIGKKKLEFLQNYAESKKISLYTALKENLEAPLFAATGAVAYVAAIEEARASARRAGSPMDETLQMLLEKSGYEAYLRLQGDQERLDNVAELKRAVAEAGADGEEGFTDFLSHIALITDLDRQGKSEAVKLMTVHTAKGMEFAHVFVCGLNEGVFPSRQTATPEEMEEERRLAYVAMTRAKDRLFLSEAEGLAADGLFKYPSRFIFEAGRENLELVVELDAALVAHARNHQNIGGRRLTGQIPVFTPGDRVLHAVFGGGVVTAILADEGCYAIRFDALATERNIRFSVEMRGEKSAGETPDDAGEEH